MGTTVVGWLAVIFSTVGVLIGVLCLLDYLKAKRKQLPPDHYQGTAFVGMFACALLLLGAFLGFIYAVAT